jgi:uncharacterized protein
VSELLSHLAGWCGAVPFPAFGTGGAAVSMLLAGLVASPTHCGPMCGGFVLGQVSDRMARLPPDRLSECQRLRAAGLAPYHLGRISTYTALGAAAGGGGFALGHLAGGVGVFPLIGALLLGLQAMHRLRPRVAAPFARLTRGRRIRGYRLGVTLGFLPCGILYAALTAAAATGSPLGGGIAMACFGFGTIPALVIVGLLGAAAGRYYRGGLATLAPAVLLANAAVLLLVGVRMLLGA